jgi:ATP-dependent DNA helicase PIF1
VSDSTWKLLLTRCQQSLSIDEVASFNDAIRLYNIRATVGKYNAIWLRDLLRPVVVIESVDTGVGVQKVTPDQCDTVQNLTLCIGAKVMLTQNIWVELGLVNGTTGTVEDVVWEEHTNVKKDQPQALLIAVDGYSGPALFTQQGGRKVIPIFFVLRE